MQILAKAEKCHLAIVVGMLAAPGQVSPDLMVAE